MFYLTIFATYPRCNPLSYLILTRFSLSNMLYSSCHLFSFNAFDQMQLSSLYCPHLDVAVNKKILLSLRIILVKSLKRSASKPRHFWWFLRCTPQISVLRENKVSPVSPSTFHFLFSKLEYYAWYWYQSTPSASLLLIRYAAYKFRLFAIIVTASCLVFPINCWTVQYLR